MPNEHVRRAFKFLLFIFSYKTLSHSDFPLLSLTFIPDFPWQNCYQLWGLYEIVSLAHKSYVQGCPSQLSVSLPSIAFPSEPEPILPAYLIYIFWSQNPLHFFPLITGRVRNTCPLLPRQLLDLLISLHCILHLHALFNRIFAFEIVDDMQKVDVCYSSTYLSSWKDLDGKAITVCVYLG